LHRETIERRTLTVKKYIVFNCISIIAIISAYWYPVELVATNTSLQEPVKETVSDLITKYSNEYGVDESLVRKIIGCESSMYGGAINHNRNKDGSIWSTDFGLLQVNDYFHEATMIKLGLDIRNQNDSLKYGIMMLKSQGTSPWNASKKCWSKI
jgi:soluble lytic murein transglycosylase-like protein